MKKYFWIQFYNLRTMINHKVNLILELLTLFLKQLVAFTFIYVIFNNIPSLLEWSINDLILFLAVYMINTGVADTFTTSLYNIEKFVRRGEFDRMLVKPLPVFLQVLSSRIDITNIVNVITGTFLLCILFKIEYILFDFRFLVIISFFMVVSLIIIYGLRIITMSIAFWTQTSLPIAVAIGNINEFSKYPIDIYGNSIYWTLIHVLPYAYISYFPAMLILNKISYCEVGLYMVISIPLLMIVANTIWCKGLKRYESSGH